MQGYFVLENERQGIHMSGSSQPVYFQQGSWRDHAKFVFSKVFHLLHENRVSKSQKIIHNKEQARFLKRLPLSSSAGDVKKRLLSAASPLPFARLSIETYSKDCSFISFICLD